MKCSFKNCKGEIGLIYLGSFMCWHHWSLKCKREERNLEPIKDSEDLRRFV